MNPDLDLEPDEDAGADTAAGGRPRRTAGVAGFARRLIDRFRPGRPDDAAIAEIDGVMPSGPEFQGYVVNFIVLTVFSASIASLGLLADSGAVVIGAMLVAPLMGPITASAVAIVRAHNVALVRALLLVALGTVLAIGTGWAVATLTASDIASSADLPREVASRTFPSLIDLGVAITAGAAAGFITTRPSINSALPGVGISVALVPPLAVVGITLHGGLTEQSRNALLLFGTNLAAIVFAAAIILLWSGFRPTDERGRRGVGVRLLITLGFVAAVAFPLALHTQQSVRERNVDRDVLAAIAEWDPDVRVVQLEITLAGRRATIDVDAVGPTEAPEVWRLAADLRARTGYEVDLELNYELSRRFEVSSR